MVPPVVIRGKLIFEGGPPPAVRDLVVQAYPSRGTVAMATGRRRPPGRVNPDLTFEVGGLFGPSQIDVMAPSEWVVKSVRYGGQERAGIPTEFRPQTDGSAVEIVLTNRPARLIARVLSDTGQPVRDARVVLFPADPNQWAATGRLGSSRSGIVREDAYEFGNLRPTEYLVAVLPPAMPFSDTDRRAYEEISKTAERVTLVEGEQRTIELTIRR
jgi:hypothetical protein